MGKLLLIGLAVYLVLALGFVSVAWNWQQGIDTLGEQIRPEPLPVVTNTPSPSVRYDGPRERALFEEAIKVDWSLY